MIMGVIVICGGSAFAQSDLDMPPLPSVPQNDYEAGPAPVLPPPANDQQKLERNIVKQMFGMKTDEDFEYPRSRPKVGCNSNLTQ